MELIMMNMNKQRKYNESFIWQTAEDYALPFDTIKSVFLSTSSAVTFYEKLEQLLEEKRNQNVNPNKKK